MSRYELLQRERERVLRNLESDRINRSKWLVTLMDIDDEIEEIKDKSDTSSSIKH